MIGQIPSRDGTHRHKQTQHQNHQRCGLVLGSWDEGGSLLDYELLVAKTIAQPFSYKYFQMLSNWFGPGLVSMEPKPIVKPLSESRPTAGLQRTPYSWHHCLPKKRLRARCNVYDNVMEFWVVTRERGSQEDAREIEDKKRSLEKARLEIYGFFSTNLWCSFGTICIKISPTQT